MEDIRAYTARCISPSRSPLASIRSNLRQPCWSPDDTQIIYNGGNDEYPTGSLWLIAADGSSKTELVRREKGTKRTNPFFPSVPNRVFPVWKR